MVKRFLVIAVLGTFLFAVFNWYEEGHFIGFLWSTVGAILGLGISSGVYVLNASKRWLPSPPFAIAAILIALVSLLLYGIYALNGKAASLESAAHMHIVIAPIYLTALSIFATIVALIASLLWKVFMQRNVARR